MSGSFNDDTELILEAIDDQIERHNEQLAAQARTERRRQPTQQYLGHNQTTGQAIVRSIGSPGAEGVTSLSNTQARPGQPGRDFAGGMDTGNVSLEEIFIPQGKKTGDIKVVAYRFNGTFYEIWLGGDRKDPQLVKTNIPSGPSAWLDLTGAGEDDWIIAVQWGFGSNKTIAVYNGADRSQDWELQTPLPLIYRGYGFWSQGAPQGYSPSGFNFLSQQTINLPTQTLGSIVGSNCHGAINGQFSTIAAAYCETISLVGNADVTNGQDISWTGFQPQGYALPFSGNNDWIRQSRTRDYWDGAIQSPGNLGPGGQECTIGGADITATALKPQWRRDTAFDQVRNYSAQWYQPWAHQGQLNPNAGTESIQSLQNTISYSGFVSERRVDYIAGCRSFTSPNVDLWVIGITNNENWPSTGFPPGSFTDNGITVSSSVQSRISPTLTKTSQINAATPSSTNTNGTGTREVYSAAFNFPSGAIYDRSFYSGSITLDIIRGIFSYGGAIQNTSWLAWNNAEIEINATPDLSKVQIQPEQPYPSYWAIDFNLLDNEVFSADVEVPVSKFQGALSGGKVGWTEVTPAESKIALSMEAIGDNPTFAVAKYWDR